MSYSFSVANDFDKLEAALTELYGAAATPEQVLRYRSLLRRLEETFGGVEQVAVFSAPGRTEIGGNHTDHQHGKVLAGSVNLDVILMLAREGKQED